MAKVIMTDHKLDGINTQKRTCSYTETRFSLNTLLGFLNYCDKHQNEPDIKEKFKDIYTYESMCTEQRGYNYDIWFISDIMMFLKKERHIAFAGGNSAYSTIAYCAGITENINPFYNGYYPELLFGSKWERRPYLPLVISWEAEKNIISYLERTYDKQNIKYNGIEYTITVYGDNGNSYQLYLSLIKDLTLTFAEELTKCIFEDLNKHEISEDYWNNVFSERERYPDPNSLNKTISDFISLSFDVDENILCNQESFLESVLDGNYTGLINALASIKGNNIWNGTDKCAASIGMYARDDVFNYFLKPYADRELAYSIMEEVRKGNAKRLREKFNKCFSSCPLKLDYFLNSCSDVRYMVSRRSVLPYAQLLCYLTHCRRNVAQYQTILAELLKKKHELTDK